MKFPEEALNRNINNDGPNFNEDLFLKKKMQEVDEFLEKVPENKFMLGTTPGHFSGSLAQNLETSQEDLQFIKEKLSGETLIDLGCGEPGYTDAHLKELGISLAAYVGVDKKEFEQKWVEESKKQGGFPVEYINEDLLRFVAKIPDNSVNFLISGIDEDVLRDSEYRKRLMVEIVRATKQGGLVLNYHGAYDLSPKSADFNFESHKADISGLSIHVKNG